MTPYREPRWLRTRQRSLLLCLLVGVLVTRSAAADSGTKNKNSGKAGAQFEYATAKNDALTRSGLDHYYDLDYDDAVRDFEQVYKDHPRDPFAANHLVAALFFRELYRAGALETSLYTNNGFLNNRAPIHLDPKSAERIHSLLDDSIEFANQRIAANKNDAEAYYARGVARGLAATYKAMVEKSWFSALGDAKGSRHDHERALEIDPAYSDARLVVGMHSYIVASLPWAMRAMAHVVGESGNKENGLRDLYAAADGNGEASNDAKAVLGLFLRREQRYEDAIKIERSLTAAHPRNFLFALEEANILKDWGKGPGAASGYRAVITNAQKGLYYGPQLEFAYYGLGETLRGQKDFAGAATAYEQAIELPGVNAEIKLRSGLWAGRMYDLLQKRDLAVKRYQAVIAEGGTSPVAELAREDLKEPYHD